MTLCCCSFSSVDDLYSLFSPLLFCPVSECSPMSYFSFSDFTQFHWLHMEYRASEALCHWAGFEPSSYLISDHSHHLHPPQPLLQALFIQSAHFHVDGVAWFILKCFWSGAVLRLSQGVASLPLLLLCCLGDGCGSWSLELMVCDQQLVCRMFCRRLLMKVNDNVCGGHDRVPLHVSDGGREQFWFEFFFSPMVCQKLWLFCFCLPILVCVVYWFCFTHQFNT